MQLPCQGEQGGGADGTGSAKPYAELPVEVCALIPGPSNPATMQVEEQNRRAEADKLAAIIV
jgi:hypothetical protein